MIKLLIRKKKKRERKVKFDWLPERKSMDHLVSVLVSVEALFSSFLASSFVS